MQATEFADEIFRLWPKAFQPQEQWHAELVNAVSEFTVSQLKNALLALKLRRAGRAIDIESIVEACRNAASAVALPKTGAVTFNREPGADIVPFLNWLKSRGLSGAYHSLDMHRKVRISRLWACLWGGSQCEQEADLIAGEGSDWEKLDHLFNAAMGHPDTQTRSAAGWYPPWSEVGRGIKSEHRA